MRVRVLLVGVVATSLLALPAMPALGDAPTSRVEVLDVPAWTAAAETAGTHVAHDHGEAAWWIGDPIEVDGVVMLGATWQGAEERHVEVRTRTGDTWSGWSELHAHDEEGPDEGSPEDLQTNPGTEPLWVGDVDAVQVRAESDEGEPDVQLQGVRVGGGDGLGFQPLEARSDPGLAVAATARPTIIPRSSWDPNGDCAPRSPPRYWSDVRFAVIHHTAGSNDYTQAQADDVVRATCLYHRNTRGWDDVGYNFLIDRYGNIYEGRAGGITEAVLGAHVKGFNGGASGISMMGDFSSTEPPAVMIDAMDQLLAWKLDHHHVDPNGTTVEIAGSGTRWPAGQLVEIPTIFTHGDLNYTGCPGNVRDYVSQSELAGPRVAPVGGEKLYGGPPAVEEQPVLGVWPTWQVTQTHVGPWELEIEDADGTVVRSAVGDAGPVDLTWDLLDTAGNEVPPGDYTATFRSGAATPIVTEFDVLPATERAGGSDSISIPVALSRYGYDEPRLTQQGWPQSDDVVIAPTGSHVAALAAPVATSYNAPLLTSPPTGLPGSVSQEVTRLGAKRAYVVGDVTELSEQVVADLKAAGATSVERISGDSIYNTSGRAGWRVVERERPSDLVLVVGEGPDPGAVTTDAVIGAGYAAAREIPLLFIRPSELTDATKWVLEQRDWRNVFVVGGAGVIEESVLEAAATAGRAEIVRFQGATPYVTSQLANDHLWSLRSGGSSDPHAIVKGQEVVLAPGSRAIDAIAGTAAADRRGAYFLLVHPTDLDASAPTTAWLHEKAADLVYGLAAVDASRLSDGVVAEVDAILRSAGPNPGDGDAEPWVPAEPFDDIEGSTHHDAIVRIAEADVAQGCADRLYCPSESVTRAQMGTFVSKALLLDPVEGDSFSDVPDGGQHEDFIYALVEAGIVGGYEDGTYRPTQPVTRAQMATFVAKALDLAPVEGDAFSDVPDGGQHEDFIYALVEAGIVGGYDDGTYRPLAPVTRAQMATFLDGMLDRMEAAGTR